MSLPPQHHSSISLRFNYKKRCGAFLAHPHLFFLSLGFYIIVLKPFYCFFAGCAARVAYYINHVFLPINLCFLSPAESFLLQVYCFLLSTVQTDTGDGFSVCKINFSIFYGFFYSVSILQQ